jgi:hypothetical protein
MKLPFGISLGGLVLSTLAVAIAPLAAQNTPNARIRDVEEVPSPPAASGSITDLEALENRSVQDWSWGESYDEVLERQSGTYQVGGQGATQNIDPNQELQDWNNQHRGDPRERSSGIPLTQF